MSDFTRTNFYQLCLYIQQFKFFFNFLGHHIHCDHKIKLSHIKWRKNILNTTCALTLEHPQPDSSCAVLFDVKSCGGSHSRKSIGLERKVLCTNLSLITIALYSYYNINKQNNLVHHRKSHPHLNDTFISTTKTLSLQMTSITRTSTC